MTHVLFFVSASQSGTEPHVHPHDSSSQFSTTLPTGTRSTFQGTASADFDPTSVTLTQEVKGKDFLETTSEGDAAYNALTPEQRKAQDNRVLKMQQEEAERTFKLRSEGKSVYGRSLVPSPVN